MASKGRKGSKKATYGQSISGHGSVWYQTTVTLDPKPRGIHVITDILQGTLGYLIILICIL